MFAASLRLNSAGASILHPSLYFQLSTVDRRVSTDCPILRTYEKRVRNISKMNKYKMIRLEPMQNEHLQKKGEGGRMRSSSLFCSSKNLNLPIFMLCRTLFIKTPGVGWGVKPILLESHPCTTAQRNSTHLNGVIPSPPSFWGTRDLLFSLWPIRQADSSASGVGLGMTKNRKLKLSHYLPPTQLNKMLRAVQFFRAPAQNTRRAEHLQAFPVQKLLGQSFTSRPVLLPLIALRAKES
jgi:hypothetical protein